MPASADASLDDLRLMLMLHDAGSLSAAAARFGMAKATLSRALGRLEEQAGMALFDRTRAGLQLTQAGRALLPAAEAATRAGAEAENVIKKVRGTPHGELRLAASALSGQQLLGPVLARMHALYPEVRPVVRVTGLGPDPLAEDLDLVLRLGRPAEPYLIARRIIGAPLRLYAGNRASERHDLSDPESVPALGRIIIDVPGSPTVWRLSDASGEALSFDSPPICMVGDPTVALGLLSAGAGVAFLPSIYGETHVAQGELVRVLPDLEGPEVEIYASFPPKRASVPAVRAFIDLLVEVTRGSEAAKGHSSAMAKE